MTMAAEQQQVFHALAQAMLDLDLERVKTQTAQALEATISPQRIITDGLGAGMEAVGTRFARGDYFLSELIWAGQIMKEAMALLAPHLHAGEKVSAGKVVIATVEGDLHDIGKNIATSMLQSAGFEVIDLGVDVPAAEIVAKAREVAADIIALSALLSMVQGYVEEAVTTVRASSIGRKVKILLGGRIVDAEKAQAMGADAYARDAWDGIAKAKELMSKKAK
jgi:5-methyltetrahydrofolate--homocysteine methyltransferase